MQENTSTLYLLTLLSDRINDLETLLKNLKAQDTEYTAWGDTAIDSVKQNLVWLKDKVFCRRNAILQDKGIDPTTYQI